MRKQEKMHTRTASANPKRGAKYKRSGRQVAVVIRDSVALDSLHDLERKHGGPTAAITEALRLAQRVE